MQANNIAKQSVFFFISDRLIVFSFLINHESLQLLNVFIS